MQTEPTAATAEATSGADYSDIIPMIAPGMAFHVDGEGFGQLIIVSVNGDDVHSVSGTGEYHTFSLEEVAKSLSCLHNEAEKYNVFLALAPHIASLFPLHPLTAPFAPPLRYRDLPVLETPAGKLFIATALKFFGLSPESQWSAEQLQEEFECKSKERDASDEALHELWKLTGLGGCVWWRVMKKVKEDYTELDRLRKCNAPTKKKK